MWLNIAAESFVSGAKYVISSGGHTYSVSRGGLAILVKNSLLYVTVRHGQQGLHWKVDNVTIQKDTWFHLGVTWSQQNGLIIYINGTKVTEIGAVSYIAHSINDATGVFMQLGRPNTNTNNALKGAFYIDEWYFWETTLTSEHMSNIYYTGNTCLAIFLRDL